MQGRSLLSRLLDDSGQDLIEYGLLAAIFAIAGVFVFPAIKEAMGERFGEGEMGWGTRVNGLWAPKDP